MACSIDYFLHLSVLFVNWLSVCVVVWLVGRSFDSVPEWLVAWLGVGLIVYLRIALIVCLIECVFD